MGAIQILAICLYIIAGVALAVSIYSKAWPSTKGRLIQACIEAGSSEGHYVNGAFQWKN